MDNSFIVLLLNHQISHDGRAGRLQLNGGPTKQHTRSDYQNLAIMKAVTLRLQTLTIRHQISFQNTILYV